MEGRSDQGGVLGGLIAAELSRRVLLEAQDRARLGLRACCGGFYPSPCVLVSRPFLGVWRSSLFLSHSVLCSGGFRSNSILVSFKIPCPVPPLLSTHQLVFLFQPLSVIFSSIPPRHPLCPLVPPCFGTVPGVRGKKDPSGTKRRLRGRVQSLSYLHMYEVSRASIEEAGFLGSGWEGGGHPQSHRV